MCIFFGTELKSDAQLITTVHNMTPRVNERLDTFQSENCDENFTFPKRFENTNICKELFDNDVGDHNSVVEKNKNSVSRNCVHSILTTVAFSNFFVQVVDCSKRYTHAGDIRFFIESAFKMPLGICRDEEILPFLSVQDHSLDYPHDAFTHREKTKWAGEIGRAHV